MADAEDKKPAAGTTADANGGEEQLQGGTYQVIRNRLTGLNRVLRERLEQLNEKRKQVFGGMENALLGNERIITDNNCVPRDAVNLGTHLLFGYNVFIGLKAETRLSDVFSCYIFDGLTFKQVPFAAFEDAKFQRDFSELYRYYRNARFLQFVKTEGSLLIVFQAGERIADIKVFHWRITRDGALEYVDDRAESRYKYPPQHEFQWTVTTRDNQVAGVHPHINILDTLFVECVGGDLTIKVENNSENGSGIYSEPVENPDQTLDDGDIRYCRIGDLFLLNILPFQETKRRYFIFNAKLGTVVRVDSLEQAAILLPEHHGLIFPRGFYLQDGTFREFDEDVEGMRYQRLVRSPNGEDFLYAFYHPEQGRYILLQYNLIAKTIDNPTSCHGFAIFDDGKMAMFSNPDDEPKKAHAMQVWQTPFYSDTFEIPQTTDSFLSKIGNRDLVHGISDGFAICRLIGHEQVTVSLYNDLIKTCANSLDVYYWLGNPECLNLKETISEIRTAGIAAVDEYDKVVRVREETNRQLDGTQVKVDKLIADSKYGRRDSVDRFVDALNEMRRMRGTVISLKELRYTKIARIDAMEKALTEATGNLSMQCVEFLLDAKSLAPYSKQIDALAAKLEGIKKVATLKPLDEELLDLAGRLDLLTDVVNNLQIEDSTKTTAIVERITDVYGLLNRTKAMSRNLRQDLSRGEAKGEFASQYKLLGQSIANYIGMCDTPARCDEFLTKIMITIEELEGRFADFEEFISQLAEKREEAYAAFSNRKQVLDEERKRRVGNLLASAERILKGIRNRSDSFKALDEVNTYFASDLMVTKLRDIIEKLQELGDSVKADDLLGQLKTMRDGTVRKLRDKLEIFEAGGDLIKFGDYRFSVNTQPLALTTVMRDTNMYFHLTGTDFYELVEDPDFLTTKPLWQQELVSESRDVYRAEYLAYRMLMAATHNRDGLTFAILEAALEATAKNPAAMEEQVRAFAADRYSEGYEKGIHDHDGAKILIALVRLYRDVQLLRYDSTSRAHAILFWAYYDDATHKQLLRDKMRSYGKIARILDHRESRADYIAELHTALVQFYANIEPGVQPAILRSAAEFLFHELQDEHELLFTINSLAQDLHDRFMGYLAERKARTAFREDIDKVAGSVKARLNLIYDWVATYVRKNEPPEAVHLIWEVIALISAVDVIKNDTQSISTFAGVTNLLGQHPLIQEKSLDIYFDRFLLKMNHFVNDQVPLFEQYQRQRNELTVKRRQEMRLSEFESKVMGSFVRNKLINDVYLNLIGANFAKQMGAAGEAKRTDLMGLLLLVSPPGYGKTTLMEYVANRLGLTFMKINGPAIGHAVTSLDPQEAPNATAREELFKLNLSFEMGNNVMIYLDDIQHLNPELLQKFISLCDAQRKIEGVYRGKSKTYDLRGKKVAVVMAGNPYTESGEKFKIPDMLANRADTYNLGDISGSHGDAFALSFIENSMTSNPVLAKISTHSHADLYRFVQILETGSQDGIQFDYHYPAADVNEILNVLGKLRQVQKVVLRVNQQYIASAAQSDDYRTEPPFKLQGSYRNMNKMCEKIYTVMTDAEVKQVIADHYNNESQTLTTGAESNLLKFKDMLNLATPVEKARWEEIKKEFNRRKMFAGVDDGDQMGKVLGMLASFNTGISDICTVLERELGGGLRDALVASRPEPVDLAPLVLAVDALRDGAGPGAAGRNAGGASPAVATPTVDLTPLVLALGELREDLRQRDATASAARAGERPLDLTPVVTALERIRDTAVEQAPADMRRESARAWERQITALECMLPILDAIRVQSDTFLKLKDMLENLVNGTIQVEVKR